MQKEIRSWSKQCNSCQACKINIHNKPQLTNLPIPHKRWMSVNIDVAGPLTLCRGYRYVLVVVCRFTRFMTAIPMIKCDAESVSDAFMWGYTSMFGAPRIVFADNASYFKSVTFTTLLQEIGTDLQFSIPYCARTNSLVERSIKTLKTSLKAHGNAENWVSHLGWALWGIRASVKTDLGFTSYELMFGENVRLPCEMVEYTDPTARPSQCVEYVKDIYEFLDAMKPTRTRVDRVKEVLQKDLHRCQYVYVKEPSQMHGLRKTYLGPYRVLKRGKHHLVISISGRTRNVSLNDVKTAYYEGDGISDFSQTDVQPTTTSDSHDTENCEEHVAAEHVSHADVDANAENTIQFQTAVEPTASVSGSDIIAHSGAQNSEIVSDYNDPTLPSRPIIDKIITTRTGRTVSKPQALKDHVVSAVYCSNNFDGVDIRAPK